MTSGFAPRLLSNDAWDVNMEIASDGQNLEHRTLNVERPKGLEQLERLERLALFTVLIYAAISRHGLKRVNV
jgi:hypothetical protein